MAIDPTTTIGLIVGTQQQILEMRGSSRPLRFRRPRRQRVPVGLERSYAKQLRENAELANNLIMELLIPRLGEIQRMAGIRDAANIDVEDWAALLAQLFTDIRQRMAAANVRTPEEQGELFGSRVSTFNRGEVRRQLRGVLGVDIFLNEPQLAATLANFTTDNVSLIKSISDRFFGEVEGIVSRGFRGGRRAAELIPQIRDRFSVTQGRAKLIARDQISKLNGQLTRQRQTGLGIDEYIWRTSRDERVRESHRRLEGTTQRWNKPPIVSSGGRREHPGGDFQ